MNNLSTSPNPSQTNLESEYTPEDWQKHLANLVGFEDDLDDVNDNLEITSHNHSHLVPLNPIPSDEDVNNSPKSSKSLAANPLAKIAVVGGGTLIAVMTMGIFLSQIMGGGDNKSSLPNPLTTPIPEPQITPLNPQAEIEVLKTKLALSEQAKAVKSAQMQLRNLQSPPQPATTNNINNNQNNRPTSTPTTTQPQTPPRVIVQRVPTPAQTVYVPRIVTVEKERIVQVPQQVPTQPRILPPPSQITPTPTPTPVIANTPVANIPRPTTPNTNRILNPEDDLDTSSPETPPTPSQDNFANNTPRTPSPLQTASHNRKSVAIGTSARGVLAIALFGESQKSPTTRGNNDHTFVIRLTEPLKNRDGSIALPTDTELLAQISNITDGGMIQLQGKSVIINQNNESRMINLPEGAIRVSAPQGKPLIAEQYPKRGRAIAGMDAGLFVLGGIGKIAELSNRTDSQIITTAGGNIVSQNNPRTNILTGALEGGMNAIVPQITARNQQAIAEMSRRGNIWFMPAGTRVEVFVNQQLQF